MKPIECLKIKFNNIEDGKEELIRILTTQHSPWKAINKKPCRVYKCPICSTKHQQIFHLTSSIDIKEYN